MADLRKAAKGRACEVRLPGICNFDPDTTVLAHVRIAGITGGAQKAPDILGAHCCSACHDEVDRRTRNLSSDDVKRWFYEGIFRTQVRLLNEGLIKC
ncbi:DUF1364 domain-containing protein [Luteibacter sp. Sphag1AF]|uniref:DUF1364 domain-containing protein n=1 Tax=Luteibacter sp. Sphag1AF TaxID=2587031 RepID=UPI00161699C0|nr:DUF1364 domain-containing protein [Luteibacter sp. Sphag1AF]